MSHFKKTKRFIISTSVPTRHTFLLLFCWYPPLALLHYPRRASMEGGKAPCFHLSMNSISLGARFTEPARGNKDVLIRNIRGGGGKKKCFFWL